LILLKRSGTNVSIPLRDYGSSRCPNRCPLKCRPSLTKSCALERAIARRVPDPSSGFPQRRSFWLGKDARVCQPVGDIVGERGTTCGSLGAPLTIWAVMLVSGVFKTVRFVSGSSARPGAPRPPPRASRGCANESLRLRLTLREEGQAAGLESSNGLGAITES
jgi:hypothetical protein